MGYIRHNAIIVTGDDFPLDNKFDRVYEKAKKIFGNLVSNVVPALTNHYQTFFIAPDGSKEGWDLSDEYDQKRKEFADFIDSLAYDDGSNSIDFVDVGYDEYCEVKIDRNNKGINDEE
jgi:hypothetical protein